MSLAAENIEETTGVHYMRSDLAPIGRIPTANHPPPPVSAYLRPPPHPRSTGCLMKLSATHLKRYREIARLFWKYGRSDLVKQIGVDDEEVKGYEDDANFKRHADKKNGEVT